MFTNLSSLGVNRIGWQVFVADKERDRHRCEQSGVVSPSFHLTVTIPRVVRTRDTGKMPGERRHSPRQSRYARHIGCRRQERAHAQRIVSIAGNYKLGRTRVLK